MSKNVSIVILNELTIKIIPAIVKLSYVRATITSRKKRPFLPRAFSTMREYE